ncbi:MAG: divergent polysaccharide deacetylase family protein [Halieaceae bacterium]|nr:divergent polysaccharide deacetylase family protein [Halieaceae bacterium]
MLLSIAHLGWADQPSLIIIIDDLGYELDAGQRAVALPGKINLAVLPHTPNGPEIARLGMAAGKEIMLHAPMTSLRKLPPGKGVLTPFMREEELRRTLARCLDSTPGVRGVNNHMGSLLTRRREPMAWVMEELASRGLYYVDSRTISKSVAGTVAEERGVPNLSRNVFLDHEINATAIHYRFKEALAIADRRGMAVAIGHPHDVTLDYLRRQLPRLERKGYQLKLVSEVLAPQLAQYQRKPKPRPKPLPQVVAVTAAD